MAGFGPGRGETWQTHWFAGKAAEFDVQVHAVAAPALPELNDEFFAKFGVEEGGIDAFRAEVRKNMERELRQAIKTKVKTQVMDGLLANVPGPVIVLVGSAILGLSPFLKAGLVPDRPP